MLVLEIYCNKLQGIAFSIAFIKKSLHHNLVPTFAKVQCQLFNNKCKTRVEQFSRTQKEYADLSRNHENFVEQLKYKYYGAILFRMFYNNILAILRRSKLEQFKSKNNKLRILLRILKL